MTTLEITEAILYLSEAASKELSPDIRDRIEEKIKQLLTLI